MAYNKKNIQTTLNYAYVNHNVVKRREVDDIYVTNELRVSGSFVSTGSMYSIGEFINSGSFVSTGSIFISDNIELSGTITMSGTISLSGTTSFFGNVGIGTSSPDTELDIHGASYPYLTIESANANGGGIELKSSTGVYDMYLQGADLRFWDGQDRIAFMSGGYVGIGTTSPSTNFHVVGPDGKAEGTPSLGTDDIVLFQNAGAAGDNCNIAIAAGTTGNASVFFGDKDNRDDGWVIYSNNDRKLYLGTAAASQLIIDSAGNVGIGTTGPSELLHLLGTTPIQWIQKNGSGETAFGKSTSGLQLSAGSMDNTNKYTPSIKFMSTDGAFTTDNPKLGAVIVGRSTENYGADTDGGMAIDFAVTSTNPGASNTPAIAMSIYEGYVGIGTTNPLRPLHIYSGASSGTPSTSTRVIIEDDTAAYLGFLVPDANACGIAFGDSSSAIAGLIDYNHSTNDLTFRVNSATRMTISGSGKVGIGTTSPSGGLHIHGHDYPLVMSSTGDTTDKRRWRFDINGQELRLQALTDADAWASGPMTWNHDGAVGIGTSPSYDFHVDGGGVGSQNIAAFFDNAAGDNTNHFISIGKAYGDETCIHVGHHYDNDGATSSYSWITNGGDDSTQGITLKNGGNVGIGTTTPEGKLEISTPSDIGVQAVTIDQNDADKPFIDFQGTSGSNATATISTLTTPGALTGFIQIEINGSKYWMPYYADPS